MPYYRHKIIANSKSFQPLKCQEFDLKPPKYTWYRGVSLDVAFQSRDIERQYRLANGSERKWDVQLAASIQFLTSLILLLYFAYIHTSRTTDVEKSEVEALLYSAAASVAAFFGLLVISFTIGFHHSLLISSIFTLVVGYLSTILVAVFHKDVIHPVHVVFLGYCPLISAYILLYLPFSYLIISGVLYSIIYVILLNGAQGPESKHIILLFLSLLGCNVLGAVARFYREISSRRLFQKIGRSLMFRQRSLEETCLKEVLIRSIMPEGVCHSILHEGMLHDVVLCRDAENVMRNLPIKMMEPVSILFADLVGFTAMSSTLEAAELVSLLTDLYGRFDCVAEAYSCENISILGDCYFAVSGCPEPDERHADNCMYTGVGLINATREFCEERNKSINIRVGIHTGIVLCGIVGGTKFKYDVWSSDAKLANNMESGGVPGRVHLSEETRVHLKDHWELEEGFGAKREPELRAKKTYLLKQDFQEKLVIEPKKKDISETVIYRTIESKRRSVLDSNDFDGTVSLDQIISSEELDKGYRVLPILLPYISQAANEGKRYKCMTTASPVAVNGNGTHHQNHSARKRQVLSDSSSIPWPLLELFQSDTKTERPGNSLTLNPITATFKSLKVQQDYLKHGWEESGCNCIFPRGFTVLTMMALLVVGLITMAVSLTLNGGETVALIIIELVCSLLIFLLFLVVLARWRRVRVLRCLESLNSISSLVLPFLSSLLIVLSAVIHPALLLGEGQYSEVQYATLPLGLAIVHVLVFERPFYLYHLVILGGSLASSLVLLALAGDHNSTTTAGYLPGFGITSALCLFVAVNTLLWVNSVKTGSRFAVMRECTLELATMREEEKVTTQLFNTIIPKHVSEHFLRDLRYSHSYEHVGVIFASVVNFWDFYEEKFEGGMGCIRVLNEIVRDLDDLLATASDMRKSDPRWRAIQKIKTVGPCYMAASGLDPLTEEQTKQGNHEHIIHLMDFCFKILDTLKDFNQYTLGTKFLMKIGFNYGPVTDGIIGQNKVLYDIWGDTVNLSSRMMSTGKEGKIQLPAECLPYLIDHFKLPKRGKVNIKGKGEMITHFCVERKPEGQIKQNLEARSSKNINSPDNVVL